MVSEHEHVECSPHQRKWLEKGIDQAATMSPHYFCITCGKVRNMDGPNARKLGYYLSGLSALKEYLKRTAKCGRMTQSQSRLITKAIAGSEDFEDAYSMKLEVQAQLYLQAVKSVRPDLDEELVLRLLPKGRRKSGKPLITVMAGPSGS